MGLRRFQPGSTNNWRLVVCLCAVFFCCCSSADTQPAAEVVGKESKSTAQNPLSLGEAEEKFISWLEKKEFRPEGVEIAYFPGKLPGEGPHRGLKATKDFARGDLLFTVSNKFFMSHLSAMKSKIGSVLGMLKPVVGEKIVLALHLLYERFQPDSEWAEYIGVMPAKENLGHVLFWEPADLGLLQCPHEDQCPIIARARKQRKKIEKVYAELTPVMRDFFGKGQFTYENFAWAYATTLSRSFALNVTGRYGHTIFGADKGADLKDDEKGIVSLMVPFCDMLNHHNPRPALQFSYDYNDEHQELRVYTDSDYKEGEEVFISYGIMTNPDLLITYGFALADNAYETVGFGLGMEQAMASEIGKLDELLPGKLKFLERKTIDPALQTHIALDGRPSGRFLQAMRVKELTMRDVLPDDASCAKPSATAVPPGMAGMPGAGGRPPPPGFHPQPGAVPGAPPAPGAGQPNLQMDAMIQEAIQGALSGMGMGGKAPPGGAVPDVSALVQEALKGLNLPGMGGQGQGEPLKPKSGLSDEEKKRIAKVEKAVLEVKPLKPISSDNELSVHSALMYGAERLLGQYPTSLAQDLSYFSPESPHKPNMIQRQALIMRIEIKRILHACILESMKGMKAAFQMQVGERDYDVADEITEGMHELEVKRITIHKQMLKHFEDGNAKWDAQWEKWREDVRLAWGEESALPKNSDLLSHMGSSEEILRQARQQFESIDDNTDGIRIGDFLKFTDIVEDLVKEEMTKEAMSAEEQGLPVSM